MALTYGFAGLRDRGGKIRFSPHLPDRWEGLSFSLVIRGRRLRIAIEREETTYRLEAGDMIEIAHEGETLVLSPAEPELRRANRIVRPTPKPGPGAVDPAIPKEAN
jgi:alpha,alpha-trehalose phosphorylase